MGVMTRRRNVAHAATGGANVGHVGRRGIREYCRYACPSGSRRRPPRRRRPRRSGFPSGLLQVPDQPAGSTDSRPDYSSATGRMARASRSSWVGSSPNNSATLDQRSSAKSAETGTGSEQDVRCLSQFSDQETSKRLSRSARSFRIWQPQSVWASSSSSITTFRLSMASLTSNSFSPRPGTPGRGVGGEGSGSLVEILDGDAPHDRH